MKKLIISLTGATLLSGCTSIDLERGQVITIGGRKALAGATFENQLKGIKLSVEGYSGDQSQDLQKAMDLLAQAMALMAKGAVAP